MKNPFKKASRALSDLDSSLGMIGSMPAQAHFGYLADHLSDEHERHEHHIDHAKKMHHSGEHNKH